ncbi:hypothetical protein ACFQBQ_04240 [Granulicella cerasi]|uniref:Uncharacterized protein n=1 Tax=Granulicella cerasi TaxID=741063 RepID=A0ABW1Z8I9_9BACT|nr:hypothetical protein [Granulicella cerasi]
MAETSGWIEIEEKLSALIEEEEFEQAVIDNSRNLIKACQFFASPAQVDRGYNPTICLIWTENEVGVCSDHYEFYSFQDGGMNIRHFNRKSDEPVPEELLRQIVAIPH